MSLETAKKILNRLRVEIILAHDAIGIYVAISDHAGTLNNSSFRRPLALIQRHALGSFIIAVCNLFEPRDKHNRNFSIPTALFHLRKHQTSLADAIQEPIKLEEFIQQEIEPSFDLYNLGEMGRIPGLLLDYFDETCPKTDVVSGELNHALDALKVLRDKRVAHAEDADIQGMSKTNLDGVSQLLAYAQTFVNMVGGGILGFSLEARADPSEFRPDKSRVWTQMQEMTTIIEQSSSMR